MRYSLVIFSYSGTDRDWEFVLPVHKRVISIKKTKYGRGSYKIKKNNCAQIPFSRNEGYKSRKTYTIRQFLPSRKQIFSCTNFYFW